MKESDILVVGGGPSGLLFSTLAAREGLRVTVLDKWDPPNFRKPCGGMLTLRAIKRFKIRTEGDARGINKIRVNTPVGVFEKSFRRAICINMDRRDLIRQLAERAESEGVRIVTRSYVRAVRIKNQNIKVYTKNDALEAVLLVGADGVNSVVRRQIFKQKLLADRLGFCVQYLIEADERKVNSLFNDTNFFFYGRQYSPYGYAYIFPRKNTVAVGVGALFSKIDRRLTEYLNRFISKNKSMRELLENSRSVKLEGYYVPLCGFLENIVANSCVLIGDAAGTVSPITGEGLYYSMTSAEIAFQAVKAAFENEDTSISFLKEHYVKPLNNVIGSDLTWGFRLMKLFKTGFSLGETLSKTAVSVGDEVVNIIAGVKPYIHCILAALPQVVRTLGVSTIRRLFGRVDSQM
ncbi:MAG: NAD(P)/FAD-dependent oxidoreductase [Candidatus Baldrarchaeia archaeon]|mgnify:CR=1 FL=1